jgi:class 3 adenylate cyclase
MRESVIDYITAHTPQECIRRFSRNRSLIDNLSQVFDHLGQNLGMLCGNKQYLHLFINRSLPEVHFISSLSSSPVGYRRLDLRDERYAGYRFLQQLTASDQGAGTDIPTISLKQPGVLSQLLELLGISKQQVGKDPGILVPFDLADLNLGLFVLWDEKEKGQNQQLPENEKLCAWVASTYYFLKEFLVREYATIVPQLTYLPSLYAARWNRAAILLADIRNFTPLSGVLRNTYARPEKRETTVFRDILNKHCREMARIIQQEAQGRIDRFYGPGVMAIFGEHEDNPSKAASSAIYAATKMVELFQRDLKKEFLQTALGDGYEVEYNESVGIDLGVGIDFGTVLFEYLGDERHREYTVIGDHVNFAKQLEHEAMRVDERGYQHPPILISPTMERCTRPWIPESRRECVSLLDKERGFTWTAYGLSPECFDQQKYLNCLQTGDWETPWSEIGLPPLE